MDELENPGRAKVAAQIIKWKSKRAYMVACTDRWRNNIGAPLMLYVAELIEEHRHLGYPPERAADFIQLALQRSWPDHPYEEDVMKVKEGWMRCFGEAKWHYYGPSKEGEHLLPSLCGKFVTFKSTGLQPANEDHPDNCKECLRILRERTQAKNKSLQKEEER